jgi:hypothetical protein
LCATVVLPLKKTKIGEKMRTFKVICAATLLALFLSIPAYAEDTNPGDNHNPGKTTSVIDPIVKGDTESTDSTTSGGEFSLSAIASMLWTAASIF